MHTSVEKRFDVLRRIPYFAGLPADQVRSLAARMVEQRYHGGQVIVPKGHFSEGLYVVLSGRVTITMTSPEGREQTLRSAGRGRTFGDIGAFIGNPCPGIARATTASRVGLISSGEFQRLLAQHPQAERAALRLFATRLRAFTRIIAALSLRPVAARIAGVLLDVARGEATIVDDAATLAPALTQRELAAMVGSVRRVVQRELKALERAGAIRLGRARIQILDTAILQRWSWARHPHDSTQRPVLA